MSANLLLDARRRFTEAVLAGVSAGVIGLDAATRITLANRSASQLLGINLEHMTGQPFDSAVEPMAGVLRQAMAKLSGTAVGQVNMRVEGQERNFVVRVTTERSSEDEHGFVVTFDDITELVSAQRNSAWADIARRIAHEIKNPLTPIQLSAERLKRKYSAEIKSDPQIFEQCTSTIIRQVGDIGRMVDEFSAFARMPAAQLEVEDLGEVVRQALVLQRVSASNIEFSTNLPDKGPVVAIDRRLVTQAVTNLVKNAGEAIEARLQGEPDRQGPYPGDDPRARRCRPARCHGRWHRAAQGEPFTADGTLCDDPRKGHWSGIGDRKAHHGRTWRAGDARGCAG